MKPLGAFLMEVIYKIKEVLKKPLGAFLIEVIYKIKEVLKKPLGVFNVNSALIASA